MDGLEVDPGGAYVIYNGVRYYRDGVLYGSILPDEDEIQEHPMPDLFSTIIVDYIAKPKRVQAIRLVADNADQIAKWCGGAVSEESNPFDLDETIVSLDFPTLVGVETAYQGDYIIREHDGSFSVLCPVEFANKYDLA